MASKKSSKNPSKNPSKKPSTKSNNTLEIDIDGQRVRLTHVDKPYFPKIGLSKGDLLNYYSAVGSALLDYSRNRPMLLKRFTGGAESEPFYQKRAPEHRPDWVQTATVHFPSGRSADEVVLADRAHLLWVANLGCIEIHTHPVRADDLDHPDELRVDLDPGPGVCWQDVRQVALVVQQVLTDHNLVGAPKTSGNRGMHIYASIERRYSFDEVRRAALALAREVARRAPELASAAWWKEERHGVFIDYNQNARDRTTGAAYSVRATPDARVSAPLSWDEVPDCEPSDFTIITMPARLKERGDALRPPEHIGSLESLLEQAARDAQAGIADAPWPPHYRKQPGENSRAPRSRQRMPLIVIARAQHREDALAGLERWKAQHPQAAALVQTEDILVDSMRGRYKTWTRIRINLRNVPQEQRPAEAPDPDEMS